jgi:SAM-dependent methyltransferase
MSATESERRTHWETVYSTKQPEDVTWYQPEPELSLKLIRRTLVRRDAAIVDIGGGASTLADHLVRDGFTDLTVVDIAEPALQHAQRRLGPSAERVRWIATDVASWRPARAIDLWHDRAALHFLTNESDQRAYADVLRATLRPGGWAIIGGFAPHGPLKCSGLDVVRHDTESLTALLGKSFVLMETHGEIHVTPQGREQAFRFHLFSRK